MNISQDISLKFFNSIESISFYLQKIKISLILTWTDSKKNGFILENWTLKKIIFERRGFQGGSDEKMMRMCLGRKIVVAGLPPFVMHLTKIWNTFKEIWNIIKQKCKYVQDNICSIFGYKRSNCTVNQYFVFNKFSSLV